MKDRIKKWKFFNIFEYDLEEEFLRDMHKKGYAYEKMTGLGRYSFEKVEPEDYIYKLDYPGEFRIASDKEDYLQIFKDSGWEYLGDNFEYTYFRKKAKEDVNLDIFSDEESKKFLLERIFKTRFMPLMMIFGFLLILNISHLELDFERASIFFKVMRTISLALSIGGVIALARANFSYRRIIKKLDEN